jgi:adenylate cyclase
MGTDEVGTLKGLTERRAILDRLIGEHRGRIANTAGDSVLAEFGSAVDAVQCAVEAQTALAEANSSQAPDCRICFRIGIHIGDVMVRAGDLFGDGVNIAARLQSHAKPGGVCISGATYDQVRKVLPMTFADLGALQVKNIEEPIRAYQLGASSETLEATIARAVETDSPPFLPDKPSIAVLPFQNMSGDPEQEYFADGMVEEITTALSRFKWLFVIARNSSFTFKGKAADINEVRRRLGVRYVLEGSVRKASGKVRITGQLIDAVTGAHLWADRFDGALEDVFDLQDQVTARAVGAIEPRLQRAEIERAGRKPTESLDAYDYFLRGMASFHLHNRDSLLEAARLFVRATELDPNYASPYGMASWSDALRNSHGWMVDRESEIPDAVGLARRAVALGKDDPTALWSGGLSLAYLAKEVEAGAAYIDLALVLNPNLAASWNASGWVRMYLGESASAIEHFERAMRLSPLDPLTYFAFTGMAFAHAFAGRYDEAISWATKALHEQPNWATALRVAASANALSDRMVEARAAMACLREVDPALRLGNLHRVAPPFRRAEDRVRFIESLRKAGMPE